MTPDCTCQLAPGIYRVRSDGSVQHVTKVIIDNPTPYPVGVLMGGSIGTLLGLVLIAYIMHRKKIR